MKSKALINSSAMARLRKDFQEKKPLSMISKFSVSNFPRCTRMVSLVNFPTKKAGMIYKGLIFAMPAATNRGVVGSGKRE